MEPNRPSHSSWGKYNLWPEFPSLIIPLETWRRTVWNDKTEDCTDPI